MKFRYCRKCKSVVKEYPKNSDNYYCERCECDA